MKISHPSFYNRRKSRTVYVGQVAIGGNNPIRIQSMLTSDTKNTAACIKEIQELVDAGCEIIRLTVPTKADAENLKNIRASMKEKGINVPLVADIHFTPSVAMEVVEYVEKVRINPGNFVDKKKFQVLEYTDEEYASELKRIEEKFIPLVEKCKQYGVAMRIGTNHGSLSDRILNRYGDTAEGMVESALEFLRIAAKLNYHDIILSMKASNTQVMVSAYRLLAQKLKEEGFDYPFHLGVTEAGEGEDGRVKSAVGIGTLLEEGLGDTIRVSLTENAVNEIPVAYALAAPYNLKFFNQGFSKEKIESPKHLNFLSENRYRQEYQRRTTFEYRINDMLYGKKQVVRVWHQCSSVEEVQNILSTLDQDNHFEGIEVSAELYQKISDKEFQQNLPVAIISNQTHILNESTKAHKKVYVIKETCAVHNLKEIIKNTTREQHLELCFSAETFPIYNEAFTAQIQAVLATLSSYDFNNFSFSITSNTPAIDYRVLANALELSNSKAPIHLRYKQNDLPLLIDCSAKIGSLLLDGIGDSIQIDSNLPLSQELDFALGVLQACRIRVSKTEFIACPSCGRTLFDLQDVTGQIKARTDHLKGVKIAIMGCIVNGPGEMADADFGYVGTGTGKISLYVGKECVQRNIPETNALDELIALIKKHDRWIDPKIA